MGKLSHFILLLFYPSDIFYCYYFNWLPKAAQIMDMNLIFWGQLSYYLRETEWLSIRKKILWDYLIIFVSWLRLSAPLSFLHSPGWFHAARHGTWVCILQLSLWLLLCPPSCAASEQSAGDRCCPWPCHSLSCPFLPTDCQTLWGLWHHFAYPTLRLHTPFNTIPHLFHLHVFLPQLLPWTRLVFHPFLHVIFMAYHGIPLTSQQCLLCLGTCFGP